MIFTSLTFIVFFVVVFAGYWHVRGRASKQGFLLVASVVFYSWWDYRFLVLIALVVAASYLTGLALGRFPGHKRAALATALAALLSILGFFKYLNFFSDVLHAAGSWLGLAYEARHFDIVLPVGISFFTFHGISYIVDVYRGKIAAERSLRAVALYILFFPQLVAGPIVRASNFMPQLKQEPKFDSDEVRRGLKLFAIGFVYKAIFADNIAPYVDQVYAALPAATSAQRVVGTLGFYAQIYFDFAGYSVMAIGLSRTLGYRLPRNFDFPYRSVSVTEFWRRWHISLSTWLRDYLYISLGGNRRGEMRTLANIMLTMLLGGLWHGASVNFVAWGGLHGFALCLHKRYLRWQPRARVAAWLRNLISATPVSWLLTQAFVLMCWVPFRAGHWRDTILVWRSLCSPATWTLAPADGQALGAIVIPLAVDTVLVSRWLVLPLPTWQHQLAARPWTTSLLLGAMFGAALLAMPIKVQNFIYFQF